MAEVPDTVLRAKRRRQRRDITYDRPTRRVWVACYTGTIRGYDDR